MAQETVFREIINFLVSLGVYDVILPFLLVFTIVFAILDRTRVLGQDDVGGKKYSKKNLNAIVAFVIAFFVVASTWLVGVINEALANVVLLLLLVIFFLIMVGAFFKEGTEEFLDDAWKRNLTTFLFIGIILIFLNALDWLETVWDFVVNNWETRWVGSLILIIFIVVFMMFITKDNKSEPKKESK